MPIVWACLIILNGEAAFSQLQNCNHAQNPEQSFTMPGSGRIDCDHAGLYKIYFKWHRQRGATPVVLYTKSGRPFYTWNKFVDELTSTPAKIQDHFLCQIEDCRHNLVSLEAPVKEERWRWAGGSETVISFGSFIAPKAGVFSIKSRAKDLTCGPYTLAILPEGWSEWPAEPPVFSAHFIRKGTRLTADDLSVHFQLGYKPGAHYPNNMVRHEQIVGCKAVRDIQAGSCILNSDVEPKTSPNGQK